MTLSLGIRRTAALSILAQGAHTTLVPGPALKARTEDELDGCADEMDAALKPLRPGKNSLKELRSFVSATDGSLPSTPDPQDFGSAELDQDTRQLLLDFYRTHTGMCPPDRKHHQALPTMRRVVDDILLKHGIAYKGMLQRLQLDSQPDDMSVIGSIAKTIFKDDTTNWGRIVSLVALGAVACSQLRELQREGCVEMVAEQISSYLISEQHDWLLNNKGWRGFVEFFHVEDMESVVRNALMAVVGCAGIGAGIAFLIR